MSKITTVVVTATPNMAQSKAWQIYFGKVLELLTEAGGTNRTVKTVEVIHGRPNTNGLTLEFENP
tara:strand:+ start:4247 stop:4441 length:195 start_codon:yes stop_codon:yes gene_type:complete